MPSAPAADGAANKGICSILFYPRGKRRCGELCPSLHGNFFCFLLVGADYIHRARPRGYEEFLKLLRVRTRVVSSMPLTGRLFIWKIWYL